MQTSNRPFSNAFAHHFVKPTNKIWKSPKGSKGFRPSWKESWSNLFSSFWKSCCSGGSEPSSTTMISWRDTASHDFDVGEGEAQRKWRHSKCMIQNLKNEGTQKLIFNIPSKLGDSHYSKTKLWPFSFVPTKTTDGVMACQSGSVFKLKRFATATNILQLFSWPLKINSCLVVCPVGDEPPYF